MRNFRVNVRTLIDSCAASSRRDTGWSSRDNAQARAAEVEVVPVSGTGSVMNWACPPLRWGGTTVPLATSFATDAPWSHRIM